MKEIERIVQNLEPNAALDALSPVIKKILVNLDEDARTRFVTSLFATGDDDKLTSMVNL